jgi:hypothetical protein
LRSRLSDRARRGGNRPRRGCDSCRRGCDLHCRYSGHFDHFLDDGSTARCIEFGRLAKQRKRGDATGSRNANTRYNAH